MPHHYCEYISLAALVFLMLSQAWNLDEDELVFGIFQPTPEMFETAYEHYNNKLKRMGFRYLEDHVQRSVPLSDIISLCCPQRVDAVPPPEPLQVRAVGAEDGAGSAPPSPPHLPTGDRVVGRILWKSLLSFHLWLWRCKLPCPMLPTWP